MPSSLKMNDLFPESGVVPGCNVGQNGFGDIVLLLINQIAAIVSFADWDGDVVILWIRTDPKASNILITIDTDAGSGLSMGTFGNARIEIAALGSPIKG